MIKAKIGRTKDELEFIINTGYGGVNSAIAKSALIVPELNVSFGRAYLMYSPNEDESDENFPLDMNGFDPGYGELLGSIPVLWIGGCGPRELPVAFCIYIGTDGKLHGYVPIDGNVFHTVYKRAYSVNESATFYAQRFDMELMGRDFLRNVGRAQ